MAQRSPVATMRATTIAKATEMAMVTETVRETARARGMARAGEIASRQQQQLSTAASAVAVPLPMLCCSPAARPSCQCCCYVFLAAAVANGCCRWHESGGAAEQQGCDCGWYGCVDNPRHKNLVLGSCSCRSQISNILTSRQYVTDMLPTFLQLRQSATALCDRPTVETKRKLVFIRPFPSRSVDGSCGLLWVKTI